MIETVIEINSDQDYFAAHGLSQSAMKDLAISPLRFWYRHVNPNPPMEEPTPEMRFGSALHCAVLEMDQFEKRYARELSAADVEGCLVTIDDLRAFLRSKGVIPKGTRKAEVIAQVLDVEPTAPVYDVLVDAHTRANEGKTVLPAEDWERVFRCAKALLEEPRVKAILENGKAEVPIFAADPDTGVPLKAKIDWLAPNCILDIKTFTQKRGKSIDKSVTDAIFHEAYYRQAYLYSMLRGWPDRWNGDFIFAFVESQEPHEVRIRSIRPKMGGNPTLLWERARIEVRELIRKYAECMKHFGADKPWRWAQEVTPLADEEIPGLAF